MSTGDDYLDALVTEALLAPEFAVCAMANAMDRDTVERGKALDKRAADFIAAVRDIDADKSVSQRRRLELANLFKEGSTASLLWTVLRRLDVSREEFSAWLSKEDNVEVFGEQLAGTHVKLTLMLHRDHNRDCSPEPNDMMDFTFLEVALPY